MRYRYIRSFFCKKHMVSVGMLKVKTWCRKWKCKHLKRKTIKIREKRGK